MEPSFASIMFGLASAATWGIGDFSGGFSTRRTPALTVVLLSQLIGMTALIGVAILSVEKSPSNRDVVLGAIAGVVGDIGLIALYRAMAVGQMSIAAPVTALLAAAIPAIFGMVAQGLPGVLALIGFALALAGVWYISRPEGLVVHTNGLGLAVIAGCGFGGFLILIAQIGHESVFWPLAVARAASITAMTSFALWQRRFVWPTRDIMPIIALTGIMDVGGNVFFVLAERTGRLDIAAVLSSLYPATTVLLALVLLKERMAPAQQVGVLLALLAILLIAMG